MAILSFIVAMLLIVAAVSYYFSKGGITKLEFLAQAGVSSIIAVLVLAAGTYSEMADTQHLNGKVVSKSKDKVSCSHSYSCHCRRVSYSCGKAQTCYRTKCKTCYEHSHDFDWNVQSTVGSYEIDRVDRQGVDMPKRWEQVLVGEPATTTSYYTNYVKGAKNSLFHTVASEAHEKMFDFPAYPSVHDYYNTNKVTQVGGLTIDPLYNKMLRDVLRDLSPKKEVNVVVVFAKYNSPQFGIALRNKWLGGKKNDVVVVVGTQDMKEARWAYVFSWSKTDMINVALRNAIVEHKQLTPATLIGTIVANVDKHYVRKPMEEFAYLKNSVEPSMGVIITALILSLLSSIGIACFFHHNEFREE